MSVRVECYAGYRGDQEPRRVTVDGRRIEVAEIVERWLTPDHRGFKVRGDDGRVYTLRQDVRSLAWDLA